jgi:sugar/nucleoside kinase (ribokinase family)
MVDRAFRRKVRIAFAPERGKGGELQDPLSRGPRCLTLQGLLETVAPVPTEQPEILIMSLLVVGSIAYDSIKTPMGQVDRALGGSAVYFSLAASLLSPSPVRLVGVVGDDFAQADIEFLGRRRIDTEGIEVVPGGRTFRWAGEYSADMNSRQTLSVELNVFQDFEPKIPARYRDSRLVFLANGSPVTQLSVLDQVREPAFVMADTMDLWIQTQKHALLDLIRRVDGLLVNDSEAMLLTDCHDVIGAGAAMLEMGPSRVIVKKGEHGAILFEREHIIPLPAYPVRAVRDPTGAGDSFAGALMGHLARVTTGGSSVGTRAFKEALAHGTVAASFTVEDFGVARLAEAEEVEARERFERYRDILAL